MKAKPASRYDRFLHQMELLAYDLAGLPMAVRALVAAIHRLDDLGLADEQGRLLVEPASTFQWT